MSEKGNAELVQSFYDNFLAGDIDAVVALLSPDFVLIYSGPSIIPAARTWKGHEGFRGWAQAALQGHLPPESVDIGEFVVQGDNVVVPGHVTLRVKTTGKTCETDFLHWFTARDGKLTSWRDFFDTYAVAEAYMG
jgi:ketosteroid isomerase-like protein